MRKLRRFESLTQRTGPAGLIRPTAAWALGLFALFGLYASVHFLALAERHSPVEAIIMLSGQMTIVLAFLIPPAVFAAALDNFDPFGTALDAHGYRGWAHLALLGLGAYLFSAFGPSISINLAESVRGEPLDTVGVTTAPVLQVARTLLPVAIGGFAVVAGVAGGLVGNYMREFAPSRLHPLRWLACLTLIASFWFPFLITTNLIRSGFSGLWILWGPLAMPVVLTVAAALWRGHRPVAFHSSRHEMGDSGTNSVDRIVADVVAEDGHEVSEVGTSAYTETEARMAVFARHVRRLLAPTSTISEHRVQEIVKVLGDVTPGPEPAGATQRLGRRRLAAFGDFGSAWVCLSAGLVIVGPLGGIPTSIVSATVVGFIGAMVVSLPGQPGIASEPAAT